MQKNQTAHPLVSLYAVMYRRFLVNCVCWPDIHEQLNAEAKKCQVQIVWFENFFAYSWNCFILES